MPVQWSDSLATGLREIDNQHEEIFRRLNLLFDASGKGRGQEEVRHFLDFLSEYVVMHFSLEEKYMVELQYPDYELHRAQHQGFLARVAELRQQFQTSGPNPQLVSTLQGESARWLTEHILTHDKRMTVFMTP